MNQCFFEKQCNKNWQDAQKNMRGRIQYGAQIFQSRLVIMIAPDGRQKFAKLAARFCLRVCHTRGAKTLASLPN